MVSTVQFVIDGRLKKLERLSRKSLKWVGYTRSLSGLEKSTGAAIVSITTYSMMTLNIMTISIMPLSIMPLNTMPLNTMPLSITTLNAYAECNAECLLCGVSQTSLLRWLS